MWLAFCVAGEAERADGSLAATTLLQASSRPPETINMMSSAVVRDGSGQLISPSPSRDDQIETDVSTEMYFVSTASYHRR